MKRLLVPEQASDAALPRLLNTLGAQFATSALDQAFAGPHPDADAGTSLIISEGQLIDLGRIATARGLPLATLARRMSSILIQPFSASAPGLETLGQLLGATVREVSPVPGADYAVSDDRGQCGAFAGLRFGPAPAHDARSLVVRDFRGKIDWLVTLGRGGAVGRFECDGTDVYVNATSRVFDVTEIHDHNLQANECFAALVPLLWFLRRGGIRTLHSGQPWANWIIDDPNLAPRYGFVRPKELADAVRELNAAATIAFIPWNYRRTSAPIVELFRQTRPQLSICIHGCDHTLGEFSSHTFSDAYSLGSLALKRMLQLEADTGLSFERVMVFPQGKFSRFAMAALRSLDLLGVVNTELIDRESGGGVEGRFLLAPAITCYGGLPLFLRRPPEAPLADFALDLTLGKPCLVVTHHDYFRTGIQRMKDAIVALNRLDPALRWMSLGDGITATAAQRINDDDTLDVRLLSTHTHLHLDVASAEVRFAKREAPNGPEVDAFLNGRRVPLRHVDEDVCFTGEPSTPVDLDIDVRFTATPPPADRPFSAVDRVSAAARRYLCDFRDNCVEPSPVLASAARIVRGLIKRNH